MKVSRNQFKKTLLVLAMFDTLTGVVLYANYNNTVTTKTVVLEPTKNIDDLEVIIKVTPNIRYEQPIVEVASIKKSIKKLFKNEKPSKQDRKTYVDGLKHWEGFRSKLYVCSGGEKTLGYGFTGSELRGRKTISKIKASWELEHKILPKYEKQVERIVTVPLTPYQKMALVSFCYNLGENNLRRLVNGKNRLNSGNYDSVLTILPQYRKSGGVVRRGLVLRRKWEIKCWNGEISTEYGN